MITNQSEQKSFNLALQCIYFKASFNEIVENNLNKDTHAVIKNLTRFLGIAQNYPDLQNMHIKVSCQIHILLTQTRVSAGLSGLCW